MLSLLQKDLYNSWVFQQFIEQLVVCWFFFFNIKSFLCSHLKSWVGAIHTDDLCREWVLLPTYYQQTCTFVTLSISPIMLQELILHTSVTYHEYFLFHDSISGSKEQIKAIELVSFVAIHKNMGTLWICLSLQTIFACMCVSYQSLERQT